MGSFYIVASDEDEFHFRVQKDDKMISVSMKKKEKGKSIYEKLQVDFDTHVIYEKNLSSKYGVVDDFDHFFIDSSGNEITLIDQEYLKSLEQYSLCENGAPLKVERGSYYWIKTKYQKTILSFKTTSSELTLGGIKKAVLQNLKISKGEDDYLLILEDKAPSNLNEQKSLQDLGIYPRSTLELMHKKGKNDWKTANGSPTGNEEWENNWEVLDNNQEKKVFHFFSIKMMKEMVLGLSLAGILFVLIWWLETAYRAKKLAMKEKKKRNRRKRKKH